jgi:hypothetical protein
VPQEFIAAREELRGAKFDVAAMTSAIPEMRAQLHAHLAWIETKLAGGSWMSGDKTGLCYREAANRLLRSGDKRFGSRLTMAVLSSTA